MIFFACEKSGLGSWKLLVSSNTFQTTSKEQRRKEKMLHRIMKFINSSVFICVYLRLSAFNYS